MRKRLLSLLLALAVLCSLTVPALAAKAGSLDNFTKVRTYDGTFTDVSSSDWFYSNVASLYERDLTEGVSNATFGVGQPIKLADALVFAARIRSVYQTGDAETGPSGHSGSPYFVPYIAYLQSEGVIGTEFDGQYQKNATRAQIAHILAAVLPNALDTRNESIVTESYSTGKFISDVSSSTSYQTDIFKLYKSGILSGNDATGTFTPDATIKREELSAMLTRLIDPSLRIDLTWAAHSADGATYASLISGNNSYFPSPTTYAQIESDFRYMISHSMNTLSLDYGADYLTTSRISTITDLLSSVVEAYPDMMYHCFSIAQDLSSGTMTIRFSLFGESSTTCESLRATALQDAIAVHNSLWNNGDLHSGMTQYEIAKVYFTWICEHCSYDQNIDDMSHTSYSLFEKQIAVCDGYTGAYNLLLKLEGIDCRGYAYNDHIWTVATLDGVSYHIDTTWGDSDSGINYNDFAMTETDSAALHGY